MSVRRLGVVAFAFLISSLPIFASEISMKVSDNCGFEWKDLAVRIFHPPGGEARVADDGTVTVDVPEGTKLSVIVGGWYCTERCQDEAYCVNTCRGACREGDDECLKRCDNFEEGCVEGCVPACNDTAILKIHPEWTAAADGGTLPVRCRD